MKIPKNAFRQPVKIKKLDLKKKKKKNNWGRTLVFRITLFRRTSENTRDFPLYENTLSWEYTAHLCVNVNNSYVFNRKMLKRKKNQ